VNPRIQLSVTQNRALTSLPLALLSAPYAVVSRPRPVHSSNRPVLTKAVLIERLAAALADPFQSDDARGLRSPAGASRAAMSRVYGEAGGARFSLRMVAVESWFCVDTYF
jgi:hypothetical protein